MDLEHLFETSKKAREDFIRKSIVAKLPESDRQEAEKKVYKIVCKYVGQNVNALSVLAYAAEQNRFEEFIGKLESHYQENLQFVHPDARRLVAIPGAIRAERFFMSCYEAMGIKSQK